MQPARRCQCSTCYVDLGAAASCTFVFIVLVTILLVCMQVYLYLTIEATAKSTLDRFLELTASVRSGLQGLGEEVAALRGRAGQLEGHLLANISGQVREVLARLPPA
jgi:hypothetical protein